MRHLVLAALVAYGVQSGAVASDQRMVLAMLSQAEMAIDGGLLRRIGAALG